MILTKYHPLIFLKIGKDVSKFVVCCSCDWRFKGSAIIGLENQFLVFLRVPILHSFSVFFHLTGGLPGIPNRFGPRHPQMPRPRYDLIGPNPDHEIDINPGMGPLRPPGRGGGRMNPFGGFGP